MQSRLNGGQPDCAVVVIDGVGPAVYLRALIGDKAKAAGGRHGCSGVSTSTNSSSRGGTLRFCLLSWLPLREPNGRPHNRPNMNRCFPAVVFRLGLVGHQDVSHQSTVHGSCVTHLTRIDRGVPTTKQRRYRQRETAQLRRFAVIHVTVFRRDDATPNRTHADTTALSMSVGVAAADDAHVEAGTGAGVGAGGMISISTSSTISVSGGCYWNG